MRYKNFIAVALGVCFITSCNFQGKEPHSDSGVGKATVKVPVGPDGLTTEQRNVKDRLIQDNEPGAIKYLYVISAYSGQVILSSTVKGKVTSSGKRLTPNTVNSADNSEKDKICSSGFDIRIDGTLYCTQEVLQDDGTYGSSVEYLFWFDEKGAYHQHYMSGGQILHISSQPIAVKSVIINMETKPAE